jgi:hypothetical protein
MSLPGSGCCCGVIVGFILAVVLAVTGTVVIYYWMNPAALKESAVTVEKVWNDVKKAGDSVVDWAKEAEVPEISAQKTE